MLLHPPRFSVHSTGDDDFLEILAAFTGVLRYKAALLLL
jgi:hypothetical protein